jgi:hypothetical protein
MRPRQIETVLYSLAALSAPFYFLTFAPQYRSASSWLRSVCFILGSIGIVFGSIGFLLLFYSEHLSRASYSMLDHFEGTLSGVALGFLFSLLLSAEFRTLPRPWCRRSSNTKP